MKWLVELGIRPEKLRFHQHTKEELAHYAKDAYDIQYEFPFGWQEFEGIHNRTDFDLSRHQEYSGKKLDYLDPATNERSEEHTSELQSRLHLVCRLLLEKKKKETEHETNGS